MGWRVYLLECADGSLYCGVTTDLDRRLAEHNGEQPGGARFTAGRRPVRLLASLACADRAGAQRLEARIKARPRAGKLALLLENGGELAEGSCGVLEKTRQRFSRKNQ